MGFAAKEFIEKQLKEIKDKIGNETVLAAISGGVDSVTAAFLVHKVIGDQLRSVFIDDGLMRQDEPTTVVEELGKCGMEVKIVSAAADFFSALRGLEDPEEKRKAFRDTFYKTLGRLVKESGYALLVQGTIAADIKETKGGIKTQHNVLEQIGLDPATFGLKIVEPLKELYKPEVREVAQALGLPESVSQRMPFPGPGLATRVIGEVTPERVKIVRKATAIVEEELNRLSTINYQPSTINYEPSTIFQAFAVLLNDKATGIKEGKRALGDIIAVRCVDSKDALTATPTKLPWDVLTKIQQRIVAEIPSVVKVVYDITPKPPSTIEYI